MQKYVLEVYLVQISEIETAYSDKKKSSLTIINNEFIFAI